MFAVLAESSLRFCLDRFRLLLLSFPSEDGGSLDAEGLCASVCRKERMGEKSRMTGSLLQVRIRCEDVLLIPGIS